MIGYTVTIQTDLLLGLIAMVIVFCTVWGLVSYAKWVQERKDR